MASKNPTHLDTINKLLRPYGLQCYTWSPGDGATRYLFSRDLDSQYCAARPVCCVMGRAEADLVCSVWMQAWEAASDAQRRWEDHGELGGLT